MLVLIGLIVGVGTWLMAQTASTTRPASEDLSAAQNTLQDMLEQGPPVTQQSLPAGEKTPKYLKTSKKYKSKFPAALTESKTSGRQKLLPEGHYIADRRGRLVSTSGDCWLFVFESDGKAMADPPIKLLPNRWLEKMESDLSASHDDVIFLVSGEITCYHGQNYLLLRKVLIERDSTFNVK